MGDFLSNLLVSFTSIAASKAPSWNRQMENYITQFSFLLTNSLQMMGLYYYFTLMIFVFSKKFGHTLIAFQDLDQVGCGSFGPLSTTRTPLSKYDISSISYAFQWWVLVFFLNIIFPLCRLFSIELPFLWTIGWISKKWVQHSKRGCPLQLNKQKLDDQILKWHNF